MPKEEKKDKKSNFKADELEKTVEVIEPPESTSLKPTADEKEKQEKKKLTVEQKAELKRFILKGLLVILIIGIVLIGVSVILNVVI